MGESCQICKKDSTITQVSLDEATSGEVRLQSLWMPVVPRRDGAQTVLQVADILTKASIPLVLGLCGQLPTFAFRSGSSARSSSSAFYLGKSSQGDCSSEM